MCPEKVFNVVRFLRVLSFTIENFSFVYSIFHIHMTIPYIEEGSRENSLPQKF